MNKLIKVVTLVIMIIDPSIGGRMKDKIYDMINGNLACFKRFNGTHEIGCTSKFSGNVGVVHFVNSSADFDWFLNNATHYPYILAITPRMFTREILKKADDSKKLSGVVLINGPDSIPQYNSIDQQCPNSVVSMYKNTRYEDYCEKNPWNPTGSNMLFSNWNFPIFYINDVDSINKTITCYEKFNKPIDGKDSAWPLCAMELNSNMYGTTNSEVCLRRKHSFFSDMEPSFCDPLEDLNIWNSVKPFDADNVNSDNSITLVVASADASSMFDHISPGAEAAVTKLITLLLTAEALFKFKDKFDQTNKNVMFVIFEGETWDYIGSSRMAYDMNMGKFPFASVLHQTDHVSNINLTQIERIIEINQVGLMQNDQLFVYSDPLSNVDQEINSQTNDFIRILKESNPHLSFKRVDTSIPLPPSSTQSLLKYRNISNIVITDFEGQYQSRYYQTVYDDYKNVNYKLDNDSSLYENELATNIAKISGAIASSVYQSLTMEKLDIKADSSVANQLLFCFLINVNCTYFQENSDELLKKFLYREPARMYVSVKNGENEISHITKRLLARFTGETTAISKVNCTSNYTQIYALDYYPFLDNGTCFKSTVHHTQALSPAFIIPGYDWSSRQFSTWTESQWQTSEAKLFLKASPIEEVSLLIGGFISLILSFFLTYFVSHKAEVLFTDFRPVPC